MVIVTLAWVLPSQIKMFFVNEIYTTIEAEQQAFDVDNMSMMRGYSSNNNVRMVNHFVVNQYGEILLPNMNIQINLKFLEEVSRRVRIFRPIKGSYAFESSNDTLYYVIRRVEKDGVPSYLVSYMSELYADQVTQQMFHRVMMVTAIILSGGTTIFVLWVNYVVNPLKMMKKQVKNISLREWDTPLPIDRKDEIGELAQSIEIMKDHLKKQELAQQEMFQNISHDLKTPISIINNYAQSIIDNVYPYGSVEDTAKVISDEAEGMLEKVQSILHINRLNYLSQQKSTIETVNMKEILEHLKEKYKKQNEDIQWHLELEEVEFTGEKEQWYTALENIFSNMLRYANTTIIIQLKHKELTIKNDGEPIEKDIINTLFQPYVKGNKGSFGLGLSITAKICNLYGYEINANNEENEVVFVIRERGSER